jgi:hypothetical protein
MDQDIKKLLEDNIALNKANNEMLVKLIKAQKWQMIYRIFYWAIIILSTIGAFYFIEPYLGSILGLYNGGVSNIDNISDITKNLTDQQQMSELLKSLNQ